jgi:hypothetical protein
MTKRVRKRAGLKEEGRTKEEPTPEKILQWHMAHCAKCQKKHVYCLAALKDAQASARRRYIRRVSRAWNTFSQGGATEEQYYAWERIERRARRELHSGDAGFYELEQRPNDEEANRTENGLGPRVFDDDRPDY